MCIYIFKFRSGNPQVLNGILFVIGLIRLSLTITVKYLFFTFYRSFIVV